MTYEQRFDKDYSVEQKRKDLISNPLFDRKAITEATNEEIIKLHEDYFKTMDTVMKCFMGEGIYGEDEVSE